MTKIRPGTEPGSRAALQLIAARNEFVSFQVGLHGGKAGLTGVRASLSALEGPGRIEGRDITLYQETFLDITKLSTQDSEVGRWPDGLIPDVDESVGEKRRAFPFDVPAGEARAIWVDVLVPKDAPPGHYKGTVEVTTDQGARSKVQVHLTVVDARMPSTASLRTAFLVWPPHVCNAFTGNPQCSEQTLVPLLQKFHRLALEHRISLASAFPRLPGQATWNLPDWETFEANWGPFLDGTAPSRLEGARMTSRPNRELWTYQSCMSHGCAAEDARPENQPGQGWPSYMVDRPATKARAQEWISFLAGATGELYYQTVGMLVSAWTTQYRFQGNGDGTLFYPGTPERIGGTTQVPVPSLRLKLIRLGIQDYEWLKAVSDAGDPDFARGVARKLIPSAWRVPDDGAAFETARLCLIRRYLELKGSRNADPELSRQCRGSGGFALQPGE
jgi:hypothetical protein